MSDVGTAKRRSAALAPTAPVPWRSHSAPPRKKWYRRGPLLNRQRSTTQQPGTMLYDQMVARRLVSAIAAWHDLHASLLQLSLHTADDDDDDDDGNGTTAGQQRQRGTSKRGGGECSRFSSRASSICSTVAGHGRKSTASVRRAASRTASGRRKCQRQTSARRGTRNQLSVGDSRGPSPRSSFSAGSARSSPAVVGDGSPCRRRFVPRSSSRSSSVASGDSSSDAEKHRRARGALTGKGPPSTSSLCSSGQHHLLSSYCWASPHRHALSSQDELVDFSKSSSSMVAEERPTAATWTATFAQSLQIRPTPAVTGTLDMRGMGRCATARSASTRDGEIVLTHSGKLLDPGGSSSSAFGQHHCASCCLWSPPLTQQPMMLLSPPPVDQHHFGQRRCFSVAKIDDDSDGPTLAASLSMEGAADYDAEQKRQQRHERGEGGGERRWCTNCGGEQGEAETVDERGTDAEDGGGAEEAERRDTASSDGGAISDTELDALVAEEKNRLLPTEPELSPEQLRQLFPDLSDHWSGTKQMLQSLARLRKGSDGSNNNGTNGRPTNGTKTNCAKTGHNSTVPNCPLGRRMMTKTTSPSACDTMPKCSKGGTTEGQEEEEEKTNYDKMSNNNRKQRQKTDQNAGGSTKQKQNWHQCQKQSSIIEDVMDHEQVGTAAGSNGDGGGDNDQCPLTSLHNRRTTPTHGFEPTIGSRPDSALCSSTHSSATSHGGSISSAHSRHSFHVRLPHAMVNLRKSGVHLVRNLRRSSVAAVMRAMSIGTAGSASASVRHDHTDDTPSSSTICDQNDQQNGGTVPASTDESRRSTMANGGGANQQQHHKRSGWHGSAAKRAMRKRISAARLAMRKISRLSTHSAGTIATMGSSSSTHSSPKTPASVHGYCGGNSPVWMGWPGSGTEHPLKKCLSRQLLARLDEEAKKGHDYGERQKQQPVEQDGHGHGHGHGHQQHRPKQRHRRANEGQEEKADNGIGTTTNPDKYCCSNKSRERSQTLAVRLPTQQQQQRNDKDRKLPLGPSLSWDPQQCKQTKVRYRIPCSSDGPIFNQCAAAASVANLRGRIHSDGSAERLAHSYKKLAIFSAGKIMATKEGKNSENKPKGKRRKKSGILPSEADGAEKVALELNCLHCALQAEYSASNLRSEIESAVKRLAIRLDSGGGCVDDTKQYGIVGATPSPAAARRRTFTAANVRVEVETERQQQQLEYDDQHHHLRRNIGTPDIVISSYNSEDTPPTESADEGFWTTSSATAKKEKPLPQQQEKRRHTDDQLVGSIRPSSSNDDNKGQHSTERSQFANGHQSASSVWSPMDTLKPPGAPFGGGGLSAASNNSLLYSSTCSSALGSTLFVPSAHSLPGTSLVMPSFPLEFGAIDLNSPPRSNSVDLSLLRRDIERWSVTNLSIAESTTDLEMVELRNIKSPGISTPGGDSTRTVRSRSYDPSSSPDYILRRPSRIEHLSEIFRKALAKSPVVKRAAAIQEQEQKRVSKHRTSRYWLDEQLSSTEHIWLPSSASSASSSAVDTECYLGEKDCQKMGEKRRCSGCHIVAHTACFPLLAKMNLNCKMTFRDWAQSAKSAGTRRQRHSKGGAEQCTSELSSTSNTTTTTTATTTMNSGGSTTNNNNNKHHWVHRWRLEGRCSHCGKSFQQKMFREKEVIAITCSWCKRSYHNKRHCFSLARFDDRCDRGVLRELILPPGWLLRLAAAPRRRSANPSGTRSTSTDPHGGQQKRSKRRKYRPFVVRPPPASRSASPQAQNFANTYSRWATAAQLQPLPIQPLLVFVNPKSGGNKGAKALNSLCWLLNPRQVFDINVMRGPKYGLDMFRKIHSTMRILVCGGDGTVGWVLSTLDQLEWPTYPPIALLPLGTGNDLSRAMGWGGTFSSDEPLAEVLAAIQTETSITHLDRWRIEVCPLETVTTSTTTLNASSNGAVGSAIACNGTESGGGTVNSHSSSSSSSDPAKVEQQQQTALMGGATPTGTASLATNAAASVESGGGGGVQAVPEAAAAAEEATAAGGEAVQSQLPLSVMNNYFSIGADAHVALQFHQSRSANPQMLNSRFKNRIAYGGLGTIDLFKRTWKDLSDYINVECDGVDITAKIREFKFHCVLFHNITFYAGGTVPWGAGGDGVQENCGEVFSRPSSCDGKIEVLGFTTATLAALQMGGKGERIAQCSNVRIETSKPIPMQVDGEPCLLGPSLIYLSFHNKVPMLRREKFARPPGTVPCNNIVSMGQNRRKSSQNSSANSSIAGGPTGGGAGGGPLATTTTTIANGNGTVLTGHKHNTSGRTTTVSPEGPLSAVSPFPATAASPPNGTRLLDVPVIVVGRHDYDTYRDSVERLKDTGFELGLLNVEGETELAHLRHHIQQMLCEHQILPYDPGLEWRFLDYVSNAEEGTFRVSRHQEQCRTVADVCTLETEEGGRCGILILDDAFPSMSTRAAAIGHELVFTPAKITCAPTATDRRTMIRRRISETLRIVLANDVPETHL